MGVTDHGLKKADFELPPKVTHLHLQYYFTNRVMNTKYRNSDEQRQGFIIATLSLVVRTDLRRSRVAKSSWLVVAVPFITAWITLKKN